MLLRHPILALFHLADGLRKEPIRPQRYKALLGRRQKGGEQTPTTLGEIGSWPTTQTPEHHFKEEVPMYLTDIVWWAYTAFVVVLALFMLFFAYKVREKEE
jgi:hypothetical protein